MLSLPGCNLARRCIQCVKWCLWCKKDRETTFHVIWSCPFIQQARSSCSLWMDLVAFTDFTVSGLCLFGATRLNGDTFDVFCYLVWSIYYARNQFVFTNKPSTSSSIVNTTGRFLHEFQSCKRFLPKLMMVRERDKRWVPLGPGPLKLNTNTALCSFTVGAGFGCVIRNYLSAIIAFL